MKKNRKGFTIVELVIVIAVIAILASVLIPTFSDVINKANESKDIQDARNMNTAIEIFGVDHPLRSISDVVFAISEAGGDWSKAASSGCKWMWDTEYQRVILVDADNNVLNYKGYTSDDSGKWLPLDYKEIPLSNNSSSYEELFK